MANKTTNTPAAGSRRIFPPHFKLQVLDSYRNDSDCKGNQRATARKYGIHRRQIQKWLQAEGALRGAVTDAAATEPIDLSLKTGIRLSPLSAATITTTTKTPVQPPPAAEPSTLAAVPRPQYQPDVWDLSQKKNHPPKLFKPYLDLEDTDREPKQQTQICPCTPSVYYSPPESPYFGGSAFYTLHDLEPAHGLVYPTPAYDLMALYEHSAAPGPTRHTYNLEAKLGTFDSYYKTDCRDYLYSRPQGQRWKIGSDLSRKIIINSNTVPMVS